MTIGAQGDPLTGGGYSFPIVPNTSCNDLDSIVRRTYRLCEAEKHFEDHALFCDTPSLLLVRSNHLRHRICLTALFGLPEEVFGNITPH